MKIEKAKQKAKMGEFEFVDDIKKGTNIIRKKKQHLVNG